MKKSTKTKNQTNNQKANRNKNMPFHNDQLGENASEEYKSEEYSNAMQNIKK